MTGKVKHLLLNSGHEMPMVGLGTWLSATGAVKSAVKSAISAGYRHIDCAWIYNNESEVGSAITECIQEGVVSRSDLFVTSKVWNTFHKKDDVRVNLRDSLSRLQLDYLDLYLMHWPFAFRSGGDKVPKDEAGNIYYDDTHYMETWEGMEQAVDDGLVRSIGLSNFNSEQLQDVIDHGRIKPAVMQIEIHPYLSQEKMVTFCQERGVVVTSYSSLGAPERPWASPSEPTLLEDPKIKDLATRCNKSSAQVILRWLIQRNIIVIPKSVTPSRIEENFAIFDFELSDSEMDVVASFNRNHRLVVPYIDVDGKRVFRDKAAKHFPFNIEF